MQKKDRPAPRRSTSGKNSSPCERNPSPGIGEHIKLAAALKSARQALAEAYPSFPKQGRLTSRILRFDRALAELKRELDSQLVALVPRDRDPRGLAIRVYYGNTRLIPSYRAIDDPGDLFGSWEELERKP